MIDSAVDNITWGRQYLELHPIIDSATLMYFLDETESTLNQFKLMQLRGYETFHYLEQVQEELIEVR